jgi:hypothetical protein
MNAKQFLPFFLVVMTVAFSILSCGINEDCNGYPTNTPTDALDSLANLPTVGVPLTITYPNGDVDKYSYTNGNRLSKITYRNSGASISFIYDGSNLLKCNFGYVQGIGSIDCIEFSKMENSTILAKVMFPELGNSFVDTIYIGAKGYPNAISKEKGTAAKYYVKYTFVLDETETKIAERNTFEVYDTYSLLRSRTIYEYDNNPGTTSLVDCPKWFSTYYYNILSGNISDMQLLNCVNNMTKEIVYRDRNPVPEVIFNYIYTYGDDRFPISVIDGRVQEMIRIEYYHK